LQNNPSALQWVEHDGAGFVIKFQIFFPQGSAIQIGGRLKIYDAVGNTVTGDPTIQYKWKNVFKGDHVINNENYPSIFPSSWSPDGTVYDYFVYWNGYLKSGVKAAPGIYKAILTLQVQSSGRKEVKTMTGLIGVKR
jgi:hypothetical protein